MSDEFGTYKGAAAYGGVVAGLGASAALGVIKDKKGVAGFLAMLICFVVAVGSFIYCLEEWQAHNQGFFFWFFMILGVCYLGRFFQILFGFGIRMVKRVNSLFYG